MIVPAVGLPVDAAQWGALALGAATLAFGAAAAKAAAVGRRERWVVAGLAAAAAALSLGYWDAYLRGGPRIIDATSYWLSARALAAGHVSFPTGEPETAVLGRFLVRSQGADGAAAAVLFPPGYPLVLAVGFLAGVPMLVGPALAAALVAATWALGREVVRGDRALGGVPLVAAALSVACGALRYHTADTMSHGLAALCFTAGLAMVLRARGIAEERAAGPESGRSPEARSGARLGAAALGAAGGLLGGWLFATRPASGLAFAVTAGGALVFGGAAALSGRGDPASVRLPVAERARLAATVLAGALPMVLVYAAHQRLATGQWLVSTHAASYATNDGPAGCFRYGFGEGIGCLGEHGDFVRANLPDGFGFVAAVKTTARRLWMHLVDAGNAEPLALLVPAGAALGWARARVRWIAGAVIAQIAAYAPFYFDGNYPGGGARLFADVLPIEHVLLAIAAVLLAARAGSPSSAHPRAGAVRAGPGWFARLTRGSGAWVVGLALVGFAVRAGFDHAHLRDRDGGAPLFSMPLASERGGSTALYFVESDAAFNLTFDPRMRRAAAEARAASGGQGSLAAVRGLDVARFKGDLLDTLAWQERGSPPAFLARFEVPEGGGPGRTILEPYADPGRLRPWIEGESLWPPAAQEGGAYALPIWAGGTCASGGRGLRLFRGRDERGAVSGEGGAVRLVLPPALVAGRSLDLVVLVAAPEEPGGRDAPRGSPPSSSSAVSRLEGSVFADGRRIASAAVPLDAVHEPTCPSLVRAAVPEGARRVEVLLAPRWPVRSAPEAQPFVALDRVVVAGAAP